MGSNRTGFAVTLALLGLAVSTAEATWSIVAVDEASREVGVASATCLAGFDLREGLPVVVSQVGAAAAQSRIDTNASNRRLIRDGLRTEEAPADMLAALSSSDGNHQQRQYGIVDLRGRALTFTGSGAGGYAGGVTGRVGSIIYAIQGNVITGEPVITAAETAFRDTPGALPERLMAAMEAARAMGGDGRCSCSPAAPEGCGAPPPMFARSAYVGFVIVSRAGDVDGVCNRRLGCANGDYYLNINAMTDLINGPDPVPELRAQFDAWRAGLGGITDSAVSTVLVSRVRTLTQAADPITMRLTLRDWQGFVPIGIATVDVAHAATSLGSSTIGAVSDLGDGEFEVALLAGAAAGRDRIVVTVTHDDERVVTFPAIELRIQDARADLNRDGVVDVVDLGLLLAAFGANAGGDVTGDGLTNLGDLSALLTSL